MGASVSCPFIKCLFLSSDAKNKVVLKKMVYHLQTTDDYKCYTRKNSMAKIMQSEQNHAVKIK